MKQYGVKPTTYCMNSVMAVSVLARRPNTALDLFKEMKRDGIPRDVVRGMNFKLGVKTPSFVSYTCVFRRLPSR